jgi:transcriptional regulator with PAS, ATPase and Fis domain
MKTQRVNGGWTGFQGVHDDDAAANTATTDQSNILDAVDVPIVVLRRDFVLVRFNEAAADLLRLSPSDVGRASRDIPAFAGLPRLEEQCNDVIASGIESRGDFRDGDKWFVMRISPYGKGDRHVIGTVMTFTNVTALRASIDQAIYERECIKAILNTVAEPRVVLSADHRILSGNRAFYTMFLELASLRTQLEEMLSGGHGFKPVEVDHAFPGEGQRTLMLDAHPLSVPGHPERRILVTFQDITAHKHAKAANDLPAIAERKEELRRSDAFLAEAQRLSLTGSYSWRVTTGEITWSDQLYRIYEFDQGIPVTLERIGTRVHPEDIPLVHARIEQALGAGTDLECEHRLQMPDQSIKWVHMVAHGTRDEDGRLEYIGAVQDVTSRRLAEEELRRSEAEQVQARVALENAFQEITRLKDRLCDENLALKEEIAQASMFEEVVGASAALKAVLSRVTKVAPTESTVLLTGETGTGKELIARAIHKRSQRSSHAFVSVNCAAIPVSLIASELFGHEKGAFTGASGRRAGRFELAADGTIFLDEVGELPAETQVALLRVLQEREFERVGGSQTIRTNARVVAATNRDLDAAIAAGTFRSDLFYRLNVFPIEIPPLRERKEDIPLLVEYLIARFARKAGKRIRGISKNTLDLLLSYPWPGNIRELQNVVERSVVVCETETFSVDESWLSRQPHAPQPTAHLDLAQLAVREREIIEAALRESGGRVSGRFGAATKLGIPGSTLDSKIKALEINKNRFKP